MAQIGDAPAIARLARESFPGYPFDVYSVDGVRSALESKERRYNLVDNTQRIVASGVLGVDNTPMAEVKRVMVSPEFRKNGAATRLVRQITIDSLRRGKYPWVDARADQIGIQRAALSAGLRAVSLEPGKHIVYEHVDNSGNQLGSARETMVHMTSLPSDELDLLTTLHLLDKQTLTSLADTLRESFKPPKKDTTLSNNLLISAEETKNAVQERLFANPHLEVSTLSEDVTQVNLGHAEMLVILPDASSFITNPDNIGPLLTVSEDVGLQVTTCYTDIQNVNTLEILTELGMQPAMIRPWKGAVNGKVAWQIGFRKTFNEYEKCLHPILLDPIIERQVTTIIDLIDSL